MKKIFIFSFLCLMMAFGFAPAAFSQDNECMITTLPFTEGFENVNSGLPTCFTRNPLGIYQVNNIIQPYVDSYQPHSGNHALRAFNNAYNDSSPNVPTLIFPELGDQFDMANMVLEFWARTNWSTTPYFVVGVMDDPDDQSSFTNIQTVYSTSEDTYAKFTVYFNQYTGTGRYIAIKMANIPGNFGSICLDDISLTQSAECGPVQYLSLNNVNGSEATIQWHPNAIGTATWYNVTLVNLDNDAVEVTTTTFDTNFTFSGLSFSTHYRAFVSVNCSGGLVSSSDSVDFSTLIQPVDVPYFQDFEGDSTDYAPYFTLQGFGLNQWYFGSATGVPSPDATGHHALYISADSGLTNTYDEDEESDAYAVFNITFPNNALEYHLSFDYKVKGHHSGYMAFDYLSVYLVDAAQSIPFTGEPSGTPLLFEAANTTDWTHFDVIMENVAGTSKQIVFYWYNWGWNNTGEDLNPPAAIDNISIAGISCAQPNLLTATNITTDSATLGWHEAGSATSWVVYYRPEGSTDAYTTVTVNDTPSVVIGGLIANTQYEFYVKANCGDEMSNPSVTASFRSACGPIDVLPFTENFENGLYSTTQSTYIACWDRLTTAPNHYVYVGNGSYYAHGGEHYLDFHYTPSCSDIAILPELGQNINASDLMITFYACHTSYGYSPLGTLEIGVMTDKNDTNSFVPVQYIDLLSQGPFDYAEQLISLGSYTGNGKYIAFRVSNCDNTSYYIDDILLEMRPDCMYPLNFHKTTVTNTSVTLAWNEIGDATSWNIQYDSTGFVPGQGGQTVVADSTSFTVTGLTNLTSYDFYVQADCGSSLSDWIGPVHAITGMVNMPINTTEYLTTCNAIICDDGGIDGDYSTENISSLVIYPETAGSGLEITGSANLSLGYYDFGASHLLFYDGVGSLNNTLLGDFTGYVSDIAIASSGPITVVFTSDYYTAPGFVLYVNCSNCTPPSNFAVSNIETTSATLSWANGSGLYSISLSGDTNAYFTTTDNTYQLTGLNPNSTYNVIIRSLCGADSSFASPILTFSTPCEPMTVTENNPWFEDFEGYTGSGEQPFECWTRALVDNDYNAPFVYCGYAPACYSGLNSAELKGSDNILVLPEFTNDIHDLRLSFWATSTNPTFGTLEVGVLTDINDIDSFESLAFTDQPGPRGSDSSGNGIYMGPFDFHYVQATNGRIALRYSNTYSAASWNLDDFTVELAPSCYAPTSLTIGNVTTSEATVVWANGDTETEWVLQYKPAVDSVWSNNITCTNTLYILQNLTAATLYQVRVKSVCGVDDESEWCTIEEFTTLPGAVIIEPTVVTNPASDITQHSATLYGAITETGNQTIINRGFEWKATEDANYTQVSTGSSNIMLFGLTDLTANTSYTYRAFATTANTTTYGNDVTFTTLEEDPIPCDAPTNLTVTNVTDHSITVGWTDNADAYSWKIMWFWNNSGLANPVSTSNNPYTMENLLPNTTYTIKVRAICAGIGESDWSESLDVTTEGVGIDDHLMNSISLYPNPANEVINVQCTMYNVQSIEVIDVYGKVINTLTVTDNPTQINVANLAAGMYFVRVTTEEGVVTKSFVKR